jgi:hypothetical protein
VAQAREPTVSVDGPVLRDIHLPPAAWWPPAPGWWIVAALVVLTSCATGWLLWRRVRQRARRAALREVDALAAAYGNDGDTARLADGASRLLRRAARVIEPGAASLSGEAWRAFLHRHARDPETRAALDRLVVARYLARPALDGSALVTALRAWCRHALPGRRHRARHPSGARSRADNTPDASGTQSAGQEAAS